MYDRMFASMTPRRMLPVVSAWLIFGLGGGLAAFGDTRGSVPLTALGLVICLPAFGWFMVRVYTILYTDERDPRGPE